MNSETWMPARLSSATNGVSVPTWLGDVEAAFGGELLPPLGHEAAGMRARVKRDRQHLRRHRHFEIERRELGGGEPSDVVVADMAAVLAQMRGDVVGAGLDRELGGAQRIGMAPAPRIPRVWRCGRC